MERAAEKTPKGVQVKQRLMETLDVWHKISGSRSSRNRQAQQETINKLPDNLTEQLQAHLQTEPLIRRNHPWSFQKPKTEQAIAGELMEMLVKAENGPNNQIAAEILALMHQPERFGLKNCQSLANPDLAFIDTDSGDQMVVKAVGEVKLGFLNQRAYGQLGHNGFQESFKIIAEFLRGQDIPGLEHVCQKGGQIVIAKDFKQIIFVPSDRNTKNPESLISSTQPISEWEKRQLVKILTSDQVEIRPIPFSTKEIKLMTKLLLEEINNYK